MRKKINKRLICADDKEIIENSKEILIKLNKELLENDKRLNKEYIKTLENYRKIYKESYDNLNIYFSKNESVEEILNRSFFEIIKSIIKERRIRKRKAPY